MVSIEEIMKEWDKDAIIDQTEPSRELINVPLLHSKYLKFHVEHRAASRRVHFKILRMKQIKWEYYTGKMSKEDLALNGWEPFRYTLKSDVSTYLDSDTQLIELQEKKYYHDEAINIVEAIMGEIKQRTWQLRDYMKWEMFQAGGT